MQDDAEFRQVAELLASVTNRVLAAKGEATEEKDMIHAWLTKLADSNSDVLSVLAGEIERAFPF